MADAARRRDRRDRLHRHPARPAARCGRLSRPLPGALAAQAQRTAPGRPTRGSRSSQPTSRRCRRWTRAAGRPAPQRSTWCTRCCRRAAQYAAKDRELAERLRRAPPQRLASRDSSTSAASGETGSDLSAHLAIAARGRTGAGRSRRAGHRVPRRDDHRLGFGVVRDPAVPGGAAAHPDHPALGAHRVPADRRPERAALSGARASPCPRPPDGPSRSAGRTSSRTRPCSADDGRRARAADAGSSFRSRVLTPRLSSWWIHLVTPVSAQHGAAPRRRAAQSRRRARRHGGVADAAAALRRARVDSHWRSMPRRDRTSRAPGRRPVRCLAILDWAGGDVFEDARDAVVRATPERVFDVLTGSGRT